MTSRDYLREKFKEKFPKEYEDCKYENTTFNSDKSLMVFNPKISALCTFKFINDQNYSLEVTSGRRKKK